MSLNPARLWGCLNQKDMSQVSLCQVWLLAGLETSSSFLLNTCPCDADSQNADSPSCHALRCPRHKERPHGNHMVSMAHMDHFWSTTPSINCQSSSEVSWTPSSLSFQMTLEQADKVLQPYMKTWARMSSWSQPTEPQRWQQNLIWGLFVMEKQRTEINRKEGIVARGE